MSRMKGFEKLWADRHGIAPEDLVQYRFESRDGYRLPDMAAHYRTFCDTLDSIVVESPEDFTSDGRPSARILIAHHREIVGRWVKSIEAASLKVAQ